MRAVERRRVIKSRGKLWNIIQFEDATVKQICVSNWGGVSGAGGVAGVAGEITMEQAAAVSSVGTKFKGNTSITKFNEFKHFVNATVPDSAFSGCTSLVEVTTPPSVIQMPNGAGMFRNCSALKKVRFSEGLTTFKGSGSLNTNGTNVVLIIPSTFTTWNSNAMWNGSYEAVIYRATPPTMNDKSSRLKAVYVPDESVDDYKADTNWSYYSSKIYPISEWTG